ncbi:hypothetical protein [Mycobacterium sp.]|uniref:hypothetical protein n=1 Tax=Mycobacterium sp. TaxID=1785 RepID=UPI00261D7644|nr:hypothetical protein [Mycobacterium sp.]
MKIWHTTDEDYWRAAPSGTAWAGTLAAAGDLQNLKTAIHVLGDPSDEETQIVVIIQFPPHYVLARHAHRSDRLEVVLSGSVEIDGQWLGPGDIWTSRAGELYGPHAMGPDGCTTMELATVAGAHLLTFDVNGAEVDVDFSDPASLEGLANVLR